MIGSTLSKIVLVATLIGLAPLAWAATQGQLAPDVALPEARVASKLSDLKGKLVYVDFWASWCGPCKQSFPWMNAMHTKYSAQGLQIVGINLDAKRSDADKFLKELPAQFAIAFDNQGLSAKEFKIKGMPTAYLIGRDGTILHIHQGFREKDQADLENMLVDALKTAALKQ